MSIHSPIRMLVIGSDIDGLILAGGESKRFGSDKAIHRLDGNRMIDLVLDRLKPKVDKIYAALGERDLSLPQTVTKLIDSVSGRGPLQGIYEGMKASKATWLLVCPCDMPFISEELLDKILSVPRAELDAVLVSDTSGRLNPILGLYRVNLGVEVGKSLELGQLRVGHFVERLKLVAVLGKDRELRNLNQRD